MKTPTYHRFFRNTEITDIAASEHLTIRYRFFVGSDITFEKEACIDVCSIMITLLEDGVPTDEIVLYDIGRNIPQAHSLYDTLIRNLSLPETALYDFDAWCSLDALA